MKTINSPEQFAATATANVEAITALAGKAFSQFERLSALNLSIARSALEDSVATTQSVMSVKTPQDFAALQASLSKPMLEKATAYGRSVYEIAAEGQKEMTKLFEAQFALFNKSFSDAVDQAAKSAPAGSEATFAAIKSAIGGANSVYDTVSKATKQAAEMGEANIAAATEASVKAANSAFAAAKKSA